MVGLLFGRIPQLTMGRLYGLLTSDGVNLWPWAGVPDTYHHGM